jgi:hypothetical protein
LPAHAAIPSQRDIPKVASVAWLSLSGSRSPAAASSMIRSATRDKCSDFAGAMTRAQCLTGGSITELSVTSARDRTAASDAGLMRLIGMDSESKLGAQSARMIPRDVQTMRRRKADTARHRRSGLRSPLPRDGGARPSWARMSRLLKPAPAPCGPQQESLSYHPGIPGPGQLMA